MPLTTPCDSFWGEKHYGLKELAQHGVNPALNTLRRYIDTGMRNRNTGDVVQLEACYEGGRLVTSLEAWRRFLKQLNAAS